MDSRWNDADARDAIAQFAGDPHSNEDVALRVYSSRLIGAEPSLVLHGGGNTSVKTQLIDDTGARVDVLCVKGSGWDLGDIAPAGLPAVRLDTLTVLRSRQALSDEDMVNAQRTRLLDAGAPNPSVETLLHGFLPAKFIDHSHADAILALVDQADAAAICGRLFGGRLAVVPYIMPGFALAKLAAETAEANPDCEGLLLLQHGLFTWGASARESYERHIRAVSEAEAFIAASASGPDSQSLDTDDRAVALDIHAASLRGRLARDPAAGGTQRPYFLDARTGPAIARYLARADLDAVSQRGPATPDHVIRTKATPLILDSLDDLAELDARLAGFRDRYRAYVDRQRTARPERVIQPLDADPRVILVRATDSTPALLIGVGTSPKAARVAADLYTHTIEVITAAEQVGRFQALPESDLFDMEYWSLEQAKLGKRSPRRLEGHIVYITGAARGIGEATARSFAKAGAALFLVDREAAPLEALAAELDAAFACFDVADPAALRASVDRCVSHYGGLDGVVSNAGYAPQSPIAACPDAVLRASFEVNFFAHQTLASAAMCVFEAQGMGGYLLFNASKAAFNPGAKFGPYALPKAALVALTKQYAIEGGPIGVRANAINADRIRTRLLSQVDVEKRAAARGLELDAYYRSNLLGREVSAADVADTFLHLATAPSTTGCVVTVDGGNIAASPR